MAHIFVTVIPESIIDAPQKHLGASAFITVYYEKKAGKVYYIALSQGKILPVGFM